MVMRMPGTSDARAPWRATIWVVAAAVLMVAIDLGRRILATNDEARFALLAEDMLRRGAWMFPELNGVSYNNKPPLFGWLIALASWPSGHVTQLTAALPSALAGVGTALVVLGAGRSLFGTTAGVFAALVTITTQGWFLHARLPMPDMLMTFFITLAVATLWPIVTERPGPWWLAFWGAMIGAFWAKGAAALLPLAVVIAWAIAFRRADWWKVIRLPAGLALFALLIAPWWIGKLMLDSAGVRTAVVSDNLYWYLPRSFAVLAGPPQHVVGILFPWVLVLPLVAWRAVVAIRQRAPERDALLFVAVWTIALLACLGIVQQQRLRYYLPLVAPLSLLIGWWGARAASRAMAGPRIPWWVYGVAGGVVALTTIISALARPSWTQARHVAFPTSPVETAVMGGGLVLMVGALAYGLRRGELPKVFAVACLGGAAWVAGWYHWELERRNAAYDYPRVRAEVRRLVPDAPVVATWGVYDLPVSFYLGRRVQPVQTPGDLERVMAQNPRGSALLSGSALAEMADRGPLRVVPLDRLNFLPIVLVSYPPGGPRP